MKQKPKIKWAGYDVVDIPAEKRTYKPKPWSQPQFITDYFLARDRVLWKMFPGSRVEIEERHVNDKKVEIENSQLIIKL